VWDDHHEKIATGDAKSRIMINRDPQKSKSTVCTYHLVEYTCSEEKRRCIIGLSLEPSSKTKRKTHEEKITSKKVRYMFRDDNNDIRM